MISSQSNLCAVGAFLLLSFATGEFDSAKAQIDPDHVGSFTWRGGNTQRNRGEFLYGTMTITSDGKISSTYLVPRYRDRNSFSGTINLTTGVATGRVRVNGRLKPGLVTLNLRSSSRTVIEGDYRASDGPGILSGIK